MEQQIRFCRTSDGVRIAYATVGQGPPLVVMSPWVSHLQFEWDHPNPRRFFEALAQGRLLVRFDKRGCGLSDRNVADFSLEGRLRDLEAVVDALALERFALMGFSEAGPTVLSYAAAHPERVAQLILFGSFHRSPHPAAVLEPVLGLIRAHWGAASAALSSVFVPSGDPANMAWFSELQRVSASGETAAAIFEVTGTLDVTAILKDISAPTLVAHRREDQVIPLDIALEMAELIPGARLQTLEGNIHMPMFGDTESVVSAVQEFLGGELPSHPLPSGTAIILFADIAESTALTERLGDAAFRGKARQLDSALRKAIGAAGGTAIEGKLLGDGVLAIFGAAHEAIACAQACHTAAEAVELALHVGVHAGDVIRESNNVYGGAVNIAARVASEAEAGETLVSATVRELARTSAGASFEDRGERELKGVGEPVRLYAVRMR